MVAAGGLGGEDGGIAQPGGAEAEEMRSAEAKKLGGFETAHIPAIEGFKGMENKLRGKALGELVLFKRASNGGEGRMASPFVSLRYAQASSRAGHAVMRSLILFPQQSHFDPSPTE